MKKRKRLVTFSLLIFVVATVPSFVVHGSGGRIEGKVTDPKGAVLVGAAITVTEEATKQSYTAVTDDQGRYKVEGLAAGTYTVAISAKGFNEGRRESVRLDYGAVVPLDWRLEVATVSRIAMTQQPAGFFGQAWPTLVFMPYTAFIDTTQRTQLMGIRGGTNNFWRYVAPHEIAHQWWGHVVGWDSYHDQWMSEGFAEFSASLYVQATRGNEKFLEFWEEQRKRIVEASPFTKDRKPYTVGPVTQGYRLNSGKTGGVARFLIYPKGAYILHMLRMLMYQQGKGGDANFRAMMQDFIQSHFNKDVSTEDFKTIVEKHMTPDMNLDKNGLMDWFFDEWVYGTEMPSYRFDYQIGSDGSFSGRITQSGVSDSFVMRVPVYLDFGKGWVKLGSASLVGNSSVDLSNIKLPMAPKRAAICALNDVLASSIQSKSVS